MLSLLCRFELLLIILFALSSLAQRVCAQTSAFTLRDLLSSQLGSRLGVDEEVHVECPVTRDALRAQRRRVYGVLTVNGAAALRAGHVFVALGERPALGGVQPDADDDTGALLSHLLH